MHDETAAILEAIEATQAILAVISNRLWELEERQFEMSDRLCRVEQAIDRAIEDARREEPDDDWWKQSTEDSDDE